MPGVEHDPNAPIAPPGEAGTEPEQNAPATPDRACGYWLNSGRNNPGEGDFCNQPKGHAGGHTYISHAQRDRVAAIGDVLRGIRFALTEDNFPFYNRHPHHTTAHTITMWAEEDVLALIDSAIEEFDDG